MAVVCAAVLLSPVVWPVPYSSHCSAGEYCSHVAYCSLPGAAVWCGCVSVCCSCGGVSSACSPLVVVEGGAVVDGGVPLWMMGGMMGEGRWCCWPPRLCVVSPFRLRGGPIEWREWWVVCCPRVRIGSSPSHCPCPLYVVFTSLPFVCCRVCCGWGSAVVCGGGTVSCSVLLLSLCVPCHSIVGLGLCLCERVV